MPPKFTPEKRDNDTYETKGLNAKQFQKTFDLIKKAQNKARRSAKRILTPDILRNKKAEQLKKLGAKAKAGGYTVADLVKFEKNRKNRREKYDPSTAGITYAQIIAGSRKIDVDRANNKVDDGSGITRATLAGFKKNIAIIRVKASSISKHQEHRVELRFEEWDDLVIDPPSGDYIKAAKSAARGRISISCSCGRHHYWYRYLATMGGYAITPPAEHAYPKEKNPDLTGVACKHVLKSVEMCQSIAWHRLMATRMQAQSKFVGFSDDKRHSTHYLDKEEQKAAAKNRKNKVNQDKARQAHAAYEKTQEAMAKKLKASGRDTETVKRQARKLRKQAQQIQDLSQMMKANFNVFADTYKAQGKTKAQALKDYAKQLNVSENKLKGIVK
ncbi:phage tail protein [Vibrio parahaemolyticus]|nr:phage tail protein [Vibrio parahaemolyticus]